MKFNMIEKKLQLDPEVVEAFMRLAERGELRAPDDTGGGSTENIENIKG